MMEYELSLICFLMIRGQPRSTLFPSATLFRSDATLDDVRALYGHYYREMIRHAKSELAELGVRFPKLKGRPVELAGFVWHQGFNDVINRDLKANKYVDYSKWLELFINDMRKELDAPGLPFVIGELKIGRAHV